MNPPAGCEHDEVWKIETNLDDATGEELGAALQLLLDAGALDAWLTPVQMKKLRPGVMLSVLCDADLVPALSALVLRHTSAFGVRVEKTTRFKLARRHETVSTAFGDIAVKLGLLAGEIVQVAPEFEDCRAAAARHLTTVRAVHDAAIAAWKAAR